MRYRLPGSILPWRVVPPASRRVSRVPRYSGSRPLRPVLRLRGFYLLCLTFPGHLAERYLTCAGPQPRTTEVVRFGLLPISLAATLGISFDFFSSGYLDVSVPRVYLPFG